MSGVQKVAGLYRKKELWDEAIEVLESGLSRSPGDFRLLSSLSRMYASRGGEDGAIEVLERIDLAPLAGHLETGAVLEVRATAHLNGMTTLDIAGQDLRIPGTAVAPGSKLRVRIQARDGALATQPLQGLSCRNIWRAKILSVDLVEEIFAEILLDVGGQHLRARVTREAVEDLQLASGQQVYALIKSAAIDRDLLS